MSSVNEGKVEALQCRELRLPLEKVVGAKITKVRFMTEDEIETIYGDSDTSRSPVIIELDSGIEINAQSDEENNDSGVFAFFDTKSGAEAYDWDLAKSAVQTKKKES